MCYEILNIFLLLNHIAVNILVHIMRLYGQSSLPAIELLGQRVFFILLVIAELFSRNLCPVILPHIMYKNIYEVQANIGYQVFKNLIIWKWINGILWFNEAVMHFNEGDETQFYVYWFHFLWTVWSCSVFYYMIFYWLIPALCKLWKLPHCYIFNNIFLRFTYWLICVVKLVSLYSFYDLCLAKKGLLYI